MPRVRLLFIGNNYRGTINELHECANDVWKTIKELQRIGFPIQERRVLVDDPLFPGFTAEPTKKNIIHYSKWLTHDARRGDALFVFYAGHGRQVPSLNDYYEKDGLDEAICPLDGYIADDDIFKLLAGRVPAGVRMTCVFDCCHSGTIMDLPFEYVGRSANRVLERLNCSANFTAGDVVMFSACADSQTSVEVPNTAGVGTGGRGAGGAATQAFVRALSLMSSHGLSFGEMVLTMRDILAEEGYEQVPQLSSSKRIDLNMPFSLFGPLKIEQPLVQFVPQQYASQSSVFIAANIKMNCAFLTNVMRRYLHSAITTKECINLFDDVLEELLSDLRVLAKLARVTVKPHPKVTNKARFKAPYTSPVAASRISFGARLEGPRQLQGYVPQQPVYHGAHRQSRSSFS